jgi:hypothetical protein
MAVHLAWLYQLYVVKARMFSDVAGAAQGFEYLQSLQQACEGLDAQAIGLIQKQSGA